MQIKTTPAADGFIALPSEDFCTYEASGVVIQSAAYEHTSSYLGGSKIGPERIIGCSGYLEYYDEETDQESCFKTGLATLFPIDFGNKVDEAAVKLIEEQTLLHIKNGKFVVSLGAEHTVTAGFFAAHQQKYPGLGIVQLDAHSDLRLSYHDNPWSHASVMARIHDMNAPEIIQIGIRAQCKEEAELIKSSPNIHTWYGFQVCGQLKEKTDEILAKVPEHVYLTIDADGFDPSVIPHVGTAEPGGLQWYESLYFLRRLCTERKVVGFDIVEVAPQDGSIISEFTLAQLLYKIHGYLCLNPWFLEQYKIKS